MNDVGFPCLPKTLLTGLKDYIKKASYAPGCHDVRCENDAGFNEATRTAKEADFVIVVAGLDLTQETEDLDRVSLLLPGQQASLVSSVAAVSKRPVILVLTGGGPIDVTFAKTDPRISSIVWIGYPGEAGAEAFAEILFGDFNPGRWYSNLQFLILEGKLKKKENFKLLKVVNTPLDSELIEL